MSTYRELSYLILDELKLKSDDSHFQLEHILFLLDKCRALILKQQYSDIKKPIPQSNFQVLCLDLEYVESFNGEPCSAKGYLRSVQEIPDIITISSPKVSTLDFFQGKIDLVSKERFKYVGNNKYLNNVIYSTIAPDNHLYLKGNNPQFKYLEKIKLTGVFEDSSKASELECDSTCEFLDRTFPLEEGLIPQVVSLILKELGSLRDIPADSTNNANDDLSSIATFLNTYLKKRAEIEK